MDTDARRLMSDTDPGMAALDRLYRRLRGTDTNDLDLIRAALADRITPREALVAADWAKWAYHDAPVKPMTEEYALIARLGKIAEQGDAHR
jgi:protein-L-isoaspartate O-methyltransferase